MQLRGTIKEVPNRDKHSGSAYSYFVIQTEQPYCLVGDGVDERSSTPTVTVTLVAHRFNTDRQEFGALVGRSVTMTGKLSSSNGGGPLLWVGEAVDATPAAARPTHTGGSTADESSPAKAGDRWVTSHFGSEDCVPIEDIGPMHTPADFASYMIQQGVHMKQLTEMGGQPMPDDMAAYEGTSTRWKEPTHLLFFNTVDWCKFYMKAVAAAGSHQ